MFFSFLPFLFFLILHDTADGHKERKKWRKKAKYIFNQNITKQGRLGGSVVKCLPLAHGVIPEFWDWVPPWAPCREPASPSACLCLSLCVSWIKSWKKKDNFPLLNAHQKQNKTKTVLYVYYLICSPWKCDSQPCFIAEETDVEMLEGSWHFWTQGFWL